MRAVILAAGYGTRLERDLKNDDSSQFKHLNGLPKALLPIGPEATPLIAHWVQALQANKTVSSIVVLVSRVNHN
jgi:NDP-sugar pyrophosphorylase family protein